MFENLLKKWDIKHENPSPQAVVFSHRMFSSLATKYHSQIQELFRQHDIQHPVTAESVAAAVIHFGKPFKNGLHKILRKNNAEGDDDDSGDSSESTWSKVLDTAAKILPSVTTLVGAFASKPKKPAQQGQPQGAPFVQQQYSNNNAQQGQQQTNKKPAPTKILGMDPVLVAGIAVVVVLAVVFYLTSQKKK